MLINKSLETIAIKSLHHKVFYYAPKLQANLKGKDQIMLESFLDWTHKNNLNLDWALHVYLLNWLCKQKMWSPFIDTEVIKELLIASVIAWSLAGLEHLNAKGILLTSRHFSGRAIGLWKSRMIDEGNQLIEVKLAKSLEDSYAISYREGHWDQAKWVSLLS